MDITLDKKAHENFVIPSLSVSFFHSSRRDEVHGVRRLHEKLTIARNFPRALEGLITLD